MCDTSQGAAIPSRNISFAEILAKFRSHYPYTSAKTELVD